MFSLAKVWFETLFQTYDRTFLVVMSISYFIQGFKTFIDLAVLDLFKQYLKVEPTEM